MKSVLIIGLGRFGTYMAKKFTALGNHVMALDTDEEKVNEILPFVTTAQIGDATKESVLESIGVDNFDLCVVSVGENFQSSLETTSLLKELGAKYVLSRACTEIQAKFLLKNGADNVVYAEKEMAERLAVKYSANNIFDYIQLTPEYAIFEIPTPKSWAGKTIRDKGVAREIQPQYPRDQARQQLNAPAFRGLRVQRIGASHRHVQARRHRQNGTLICDTTQKN